VNSKKYVREGSESIGNNVVYSKLLNGKTYSSN
jgi:hypothetical protein